MFLILFMVFSPLGLYLISSGVNHNFDAVKIGLGWILLGLGLGCLIVGIIHGDLVPRFLSVS